MGSSTRMSRFKVFAVETAYWNPGENYLSNIVCSIRGKVRGGDFVVISEKAISTASCNIVDENQFSPNWNARFIAGFWTKIVWGYFLGSLCRFRKDMIQNLREYPSDLGSRHKQVALQHAGLLQALLFGSEGGIDGSNLAYSFVSLPLENACDVARKISEEIRKKLGANTCVIIADTDKTYSVRSFHFTPRPTRVKGIHSFGGVFTYVLGRMLKLARRATPVGIAGCQLDAENALRIANMANHVRGSGAGRTVWEMAQRFKVAPDKVTWEMLETVKHKPIVVVRSKKGEKAA
ncbi:MAG: coenzyme F420-0:L-glutamate ligase [Candidatus Bathyarchaeia archaeon]